MGLCCLGNLGFSLTSSLGFDTATGDWFSLLAELCSVFVRLDAESVKGEERFVPGASGLKSTERSMASIVS